MSRMLKVSVVEDDKVIQGLKAQRLVKLGHTVHSLFETGETALEQLPRSLPDIVIMDIDLGGEIDGIDVALHIQEHHNIPFVFVSSHRDEETLHRVKMVEGAEYIVKPFTDTGLRIAIDLAMDKYLLSVRKADVRNCRKCCSTSFLVRLSRQTVKALSRIPMTSRSR